MERKGRAGVVVATCAAALFLEPLPAQVEEGPELVAERIHSNLPLYTFDWQDLWPRGFHDEDSFGCSSRVAFGDWRFTPAPGASEGEEYWTRYSNYGVFHCAAIIRTAPERAGLEEARWQYGFFVRLGRARLAGDDWELWVVQEGMVPGSQYILLARQAGQGGLIDSFRVLQQRCPRGRLLEVEGLDVWSTRYCAINSRAELVALARRMLRLPPRGTIERVREEEESLPPS